MDVVETLAVVCALFNPCVMFSASFQYFGGAPALLGNKIRRSVSLSPLASPGFSAAIDLSNVFSLFEITATATETVFSFRSTVVHFCTVSVLTLNGATVAMLDFAGGCKNIRMGWVPGLGTVTHMRMRDSVWVFLQRTAWDSVCLWQLLQPLGPKSD